MFTDDGKPTTLQIGDIVAWDVERSGFRIWIERNRTRLLWYDFPVRNSDQFEVDLRISERELELWQRVDDYGPPALIRMLVTSHGFSFEKSESHTRPMFSGGAYRLV